MELRLNGDGTVEEPVGQAIAGLRDRVFLATKVKPAEASRSGSALAGALLGERAGRSITAVAGLPVEPGRLRLVAWHAAAEPPVQARRYAA